MRPGKVRRDDWDNRPISEATPACIRCGLLMRAGSITLQGIRVKSWRCPKDGEELIEPQGAERALVLNKLRRGIEVKVGELNGAPYVRFTKEFEGFVHKGDTASIVLAAPDEIRLKLRHSHAAPGAA